LQNLYLNHPVGHYQSLLQSKNDIMNVYLVMPFSLAHHVIEFGSVREDFIMSFGNVFNPT